MSIWKKKSFTKKTVVDLIVNHIIYEVNNIKITTEALNFLSDGNFNSMKWIWWNCTRIQIKVG